MADKRLRDLAVRSTKTYDEQLIFDETGLTEAQRISASDLLRKATENVISTSGGTVIADFADYDQITINATGSITVDIQNLPDGDGRSQLLITRSDPDTQTVSFTGLKGGITGNKIGIATLYYRLYRASAGIYIEQINRQTFGNLDLADVTSTSATINSLDRFVWYIRDGICNFTCQLNLTPDGTVITFTNNITLDLANFDVNMKYGNEPLKCALLSATSERTVDGYLIDNTELQLTFNESINGTIPRDLSISGSFIIE